MTALPEQQMALSEGADGVPLERAETGTSKPEPAPSESALERLRNTKARGDQMVYLKAWEFFALLRVAEAAQEFFAGDLNHERSVKTRDALAALDQEEGERG